MGTNRNRRIRARMAGLLAPLALAGCLSDRPDPARPDPLTGLPRRLPPSERVVSSTGTTERGDGGASRSDGGSGLGIRDERDTDREGLAATGAWSGTESRTSPPPAGGGARLGSPPPSATTTASPPRTAASTGGNSRVRTFEEAQQILMAHGVRWQDLQTTGEGEWKYSCSVPTAAGGTTMRTYEGRDRYGLNAMQQVIDQIRRDQGK